MHKLLSVFDVLELASKVATAVLIAGMVILIAAQVGFRYILNQPLAWSEEVARHLMIWAALFGAAVAYRRKGHLGMDILVSWLDRTWQARVDGLLQVLSIGFFGLLVVHGMPLVERTMRQFSSAIRIPMGYVYSAIPVGAALIVLFALERLIRLAQGLTQLEESKP